MARQTPEISHVELLRAQVYTLLARLLARAPGSALLAAIATLEGDPTDIGKNLKALAAASGRVGAGHAAKEFDILFGSNGEFIPFSTCYKLDPETADLLDQEAARDILRRDMNDLAAHINVDKLGGEDHISGLFEIMAGLITGAFGRPADIYTQSKFYNAHIADWAPRFFKELQASPSAVFYMPVAGLGGVFMQVETQGFALAA